MTKIDFLEHITNEKLNLGIYQIETDHLTEASFVLGCFYDSQEKIWKMLYLIARL